MADNLGAHKCRSLIHLSHAPLQADEGGDPLVRGRVESPDLKGHKLSSMLWRRSGVILSARRVKGSPLACNCLHKASARFLTGFSGSAWSGSSGLVTNDLSSRACASATANTLCQIQSRLLAIGVTQSMHSVSRRILVTLFLINASALVSAQEFVAGEPLSSVNEAGVYRTRFPGHTFVLCRLA